MMIPQHYGVPTAALDWTYNPYVAIFFATNETDIQFSEFNPSPSVAIYAYKIDSPEQAHFTFQKGNSDCKNLRIIIQEGVFLSMSKACKYFYDNGHWPNMERFLSKNSNCLIKYIVPINKKIILIDKLQEILFKKGITKEFLSPDLASINQIQLEVS